MVMARRSRLTPMPRNRPGALARLPTTQREHSADTRRRPDDVLVLCVTMTVQIGDPPL